MRIAETKRKTNETDIYVRIDLDGSGKRDISTGLGFLDHMLDLLGKHALLDLTVHAEGDLHIDAHHTVEDIGIVLGLCLKEALGDKNGIFRYGHFVLPMDEVLVLCALDLGGRSYLSYDLSFSSEKIGQVDTELFEEFFRALSSNAGMNLHLKLLSGGNSHHVAEGAFKAFAKALRIAVSKDEKELGSPSTKGCI